MDPPTIYLKEKFKAEEKYKIISDKNNSFNIILRNLSSYIEINATNEDNNEKNKFEEKYTLINLKENKFLSICDSIDEIFEELIFEFSKNKCTILESKNMITIKIPVNHAKYKEIYFALNKKMKSDKENIQDLYKLVLNLQSQMKDKEKEINDLKQIINNISENNKNLEQKVNSLEKEILDLKNSKISLNKCDSSFENNNNCCINQKNLIDNEFEEIENPWDKDKKDKESKKFEFTWKSNGYLAEKNSQYIYEIFSKNKFENNKIYKLKYNINYKSNDLRVGFGTFGVSLLYKLKGSGSVGFSNDGLFIEGKKVSYIKIENKNKEIMFIINLKENQKSFELFIDEKSFWKFNFSLDNIYGLAAFHRGSIKITTFRNIN